jgi:hypothetical protein
MSIRARIYRQPKTAMQSGTAGTGEWVLDFEPSEPRRADPLMGWTGSGDTQTQVRLRFDTRAEAVDFATREGFNYAVEIPTEKKFHPKAYADNFKFGRKTLWTH